MDVLGVDPSLTCTGVAKVLSGVVIGGRVQTGPQPGLGGTIARVRYIVAGVLKFAPRGEFVTVIETPFVPARGGAGAVLERGYLYWLLVDQLMRRGAVVAVGPTARAKYSTGRGNAGKDDVLAAVVAAHPLVTVADHNVADAIALASMGARWFGAPVDGEISAKQDEAMRAVRWPQREGEQ